MKKIILKSPVDFEAGGKCLHFLPKNEYVVADEIAKNAFLSAFIAKTIDLPSEEKKEPIEQIKPVSEASAPTTTKRRSRRVSK